MTLVHDEADARDEQRRRMTEAYLASVPSDAEIERARGRRRARRRSAVPLSRVWAVGLSQGFAAGLVTLAAASFVGAKVLPKLSEVWSSPAVEARLPRAAEPPAPKAVPAAESRAPANDAPASAAFPHAPSDAPAAREGATPAPVVSLRKASPRAKVREPQPSPATAVKPARESLVTPAGEPASAAWTHVAEALAAKDFARAEAALQGLAENGDPATRDAAALSRAELWIARGSGLAVRADVERLARVGRTPLIRRRAAELLRRVDVPRAD